MQLTMSDFIIDIVDKYTNYTNYITLTSFKNNKSSIFSSYDESLEEKEYGQYSFSFKVELFSNDTRNPYIQYLTHGRQLRLTLNDDNIILFNIVSIKPVFGAKGIEYTYECQDSFSYQLSKQSVDISFSTEDTSLWDTIGPKTINQLISKLLLVSHMHHQWSVDTASESSVIQFPDDLFQNKGSMKISIDLQGTPYNILTQILGTFNATISVNYVTGVISLYNKERIKYKGFTLNSGINLSNFNYEEKSTDQCNILHVSGGEDAYGIPISLMEPVPTELFELFINLDIENLQTVEIDENDKQDYQKIISCYPDFYVKKEDDDYFVYCKEYDEDKNLFSYVKDTTEFKNWRGAKNALELKTILSEYYNRKKNRNVLVSEGNRQKMNIYTSYNKQFESFATFFSSLEKIPHYGSFLTNFDYWKDKNLSSARYNELRRSLNIDLRNTNILLTIYNSLYNEYKYQINKLENEEAEIINQIASLLHTKASYIETKEPLSLYSYYVTQSTKHEWINDKKETAVDYFLPIAEWKSSYGKIVYYDSFLNVKCTTPSLSSIKNCFTSVYIKKSNILLEDEWNEIKLSAGGINVENNTISLSSLPDATQDTTLIYLKISSLETDSHGKTIKDYLIEDTISQDAVSANEIDSLLFRLKHDVWNEDYYNYQYKLYGSKWYDKKLEDITNQWAAKLDQYNAAVENMVYTFGKGWRNIDTTWLKNNSPSKFLVFTSILDNINTYSLYVGGYGVRKYNDDNYYSYPGYLTLYKDYIINEMSQPSLENVDSLSLEEMVDKYNQEKEDWWDKFYRNYNDVIKESTFSDSDQLTNSGLYSSALKQFTLYNQPTKTYSASFLSTDDLQGVISDVSVGDVIKLNQKYLKELVDPNTIVVELESVLDTGAVNDKALIRYQLDHSTNYYSQDFGGTVRGIAYGNDYWVCVTDKGDIWVSSDKKVWKKMVEKAGIFTGICYWEARNIFIAVTYNPGNSATKIYHSKLPLNSWQTLDPNFNQIEGVVADGLQCWYYGGKDYASIASIIYDADNGSYADLLSGSPYVIIDNLTIKRLTKYDTGWLIITGNAILMWPDVKIQAYTNILRLKGNNYDIRACIVYNNTVYIGGKNIGISYTSDIGMDNIEHDTLPDSWKTSINTVKNDDVTYFVRDFTIVKGTMFALGYCLKNNSIQKNFVWLSRDLGETWESMDLDDTLINPSSSGLWDFETKENNIVFASNKTVFDIQYSPDAISLGKINFINKYKFELTVEDDQFKYPGVNILYIDYNGNRFSQQSLSKHILSISSKVTSESIKMRINGVKKNLRSNVATLQVEENTLYNTLVDRLLYFLRYD